MRRIPGLRGLAPRRYYNSALITVRVNFSARDLDGSDAQRAALELRELVERQLESRPEVRTVEKFPLKVWGSG